MDFKSVQKMSELEQGVKESRWRVARLEQRLAELGAYIDERLADLSSARAERKPRRPAGTPKEIGATEDVINVK